VSHAELVGLVMDLLERVEVLEAENAALRVENRALKAEVATVEDTPPQSVRVIKRFHVEVGFCPRCGWRGRGTHAELMAGQHGASAHRTGPQILAQAFSLHYHHGLPLSKVPRVLKDMTGITSYEAHALADIEQQKCLSHLLKNLSVVEETRRGRAKRFARDVKSTLREALALWQEYRAGNCSLQAYRARGQPIADKLTWLLRDRVLSDSDNQRLLDGIGRQHDHGRVLLFLEHPEIEPTNNRAERGLRGAVIARKVSHCSKNERGAAIYEAMKSVTATIALRGYRVASGLSDLIRGMPMPSPQSR